MKVLDITQLPGGTYILVVKTDGNRFFRVSPKHIKVYTRGGVPYHERFIDESTHLPLRDKKLIKALDNYIYYHEKLSKINDPREDTAYGVGVGNMAAVARAAVMNSKPLSGVASAGVGSLLGAGQMSPQSAFNALMKSAADNYTKMHAGK